MVRELKKDNIVKMKVEGKEKRNTCTQLNHSIALFQQKKNTMELVSKDAVMKIEHRQAMLDNV
jgi:hypothetical protein